LELGEKMRPARLTDGEELSLIGRVAAGDVEAFKTLHGAYQRRLFAYALKMLDDPGDAEELCNDVLLDVWRQARQFAGRSKLSTWVFGIAHHKALNALRKSARRIDVALEHAAATPDEEPGPEAEAERRDTREMLGAALSKLSREHREVVELTFYHGFSYEEIAQIVNCPAGTVKTRMFHAKQKLREWLGEAAPGREF
jgi:RNA polymerase sigma-70 factor (ECF subfamily)